MTQWLEVDNWLDLVGNAWIGLVLIVAAAVPSIFAHRNQRGINEVRDQVKNAHRTNLRDDVDRAVYGVERLAVEVRSLRTELADEENRRRDHVAELREEVHRRLDELHRRMP